MSKAASTPTTTRRSLLGSVPAIAALGGSLAGCLPMPVPAAETGPDADLIALCAQHIVNHGAYNTRGGYLEPDADPLWLAYEETKFAIDAAVPRTLAGVLAKARAAKAEAHNPNGSEVFEDGPAGRWAADVVNDFLRLSAGGLA